MTDVFSSLPNILTCGRVAAVPAIVACLFFPDDLFLRSAALIIFVFACITDALDGWIARNWSGVSTFGRILDPIADKLLVAASLLMLVAAGTIKGWSVLAAIVILCREILVSGLREFLAGLRVTVPVTRVAKWKTMVQFIALGFLIGAPALDHISPLANTVYGNTTFLGLILLWAAAILTVHTGLEYGLVGFRSSSSAHYKS